MFPCHWLVPEEKDKREKKCHWKKCCVPKCFPSSKKGLVELWYALGSNNSTVFPSPPNPFIVPAGVYSVIVKLVGGGGGGSTSVVAGGGGGGAGGFITATFRVSPTMSFPIVVGPGGATNVSGGNSTISGPGGFFLSANGGTGATTEVGANGGTAVVTPGSGAVPILTSLTVTGQNGSDVTPLGLEGLTNPALGGTGGGSSFASAGGASAGLNGTQSGGLFGGGGSGVSLSGTPSQATPATPGASGCVVILYQGDF